MYAHRRDRRSSWMLSFQLGYRLRPTFIAKKITEAAWTLLRHARHVRTHNHEVKNFKSKHTTLAFLRLDEMASANLSDVITLIEEGKAVQATQEIGLCFQDGSSTTKLTQFGEAIQEMKQTEERQKETLKDIIQGYLDMKDERAACVSRDQSHDAVTPEIGEAQRDKAKSWEKLATFQQEVQAVQRELDHLADLQVKLESHRETVKEQTTDVLPKTRYNVSLYKAATKLTWDFNSQPEEVKGYISTSKDVRPFSLDSRQNSKFFITNYLWDLIESTA
ncbi:kinetochore protein spc24-like [Acanthaster planci]|uniref:Kinetochore protein Spc24 n=1 Tax=Acanthaster planci TaxID=133434 RepID=A0A8B7ZFH9_ACAPL|nr:kinetochore protein spc24-like [Acanthaster planci]